MSELIVDATGIEKTYDTGALKVHALRGVDLSVKRGEMVAIMGPSGCGKTRGGHYQERRRRPDEGASWNLYLDSTGDCSYILEHWLSLS